MGTPDLKFIEDSSNKKTRWVDVRIPVREGKRYRIGNFDFNGNTIVKTDALRPLFKLAPRRILQPQAKSPRDSRRRRRYATAVGYMEFTGYPEPKPRDAPNACRAEARPRLRRSRKPTGPPIVDLTLRIQEGKRCFRQPDRVRRQHHDARQRHPARECGSTRAASSTREALKYSDQAAQSARLLQAARRPGEGRDGQTRRTATRTRSTSRLKLEEQNRNQLTFGAGVSRFEGFFGQLSFQTSNFLGRGESFTVAVRRDRGRRTTACVSPSRFSSTATSPVA